MHKNEVLAHCFQA